MNRKSAYDIDLSANWRMAQMAFCRGKKLLSGKKTDRETFWERQKKSREGEKFLLESIIDAVLVWYSLSPPLSFPFSFPGAQSRESRLFVRQHRHREKVVVSSRLFYFPLYSRASSFSIITSMQKNYGEEERVLLMKKKRIILLVLMDWMGWVECRRGLLFVFMFGPGFSSPK